MQHLYEKVAYLRGLAEGLDIGNESKEGKMINRIIEVLDDFADAIVDLDEEQAELLEYAESIDEDLADVEDDLYEEDDEDYDDEEFEYLEMECPNCGETVEIDEDLLYDDDVDVVCPSCKGIILTSDEIDEADYNEE